LWTGSNWLSIDPAVGCRELGNDPSRSTKRDELRYQASDPRWVSTRSLLNETQSRNTDSFVLTRPELNLASPSEPGAWTQRTTRGRTRVPCISVSRTDGPTRLEAGYATTHIRLPRHQPIYTLLQGMQIAWCSLRV